MPPLRTHTQLLFLIPSFNYKQELLAALIKPPPISEDTKMSYVCCPWLRTVGPSDMHKRVPSTSSKLTTLQKGRDLVVQTHPFTQK